MQKEPRSEEEKNESSSIFSHSPIQGHSHHKSFTDRALIQERGERKHLDPAGIRRRGMKFLVMPLGYSQHNTSPTDPFHTPDEISFAAPAEVRTMKMLRGMLEESLLGIKLKARIHKTRGHGTDGTMGSSARGAGRRRDFIFSARSVLEWAPLKAAKLHQG